MREAALLSRRAAVFGVGALSATGVTAALTLQPLTATSIDVAARRCREAKDALDKALAAFERALPAPHWTLDMTSHRPRPFSATVERRVFDGSVPKRSLDFLGNPGERYVTTVETIEQDLWRCSPGNRGRRRLLYRMRRRARQRALQVEKLEAAYELPERASEVDAAERDLEELTSEIFQKPASNLAAILVQAKALSAYVDTISAPHAQHEAGRFGEQLAAGLQKIARAA